MADDNKKCKHAGCLCVVTGDADYCSPHCEGAEGQDLSEIRCDCGHPGCST